MTDEIWGTAAGENNEPELEPHWINWTQASRRSNLDFEKFEFFTPEETYVSVNKEAADELKQTLQNMIDAQQVLRQAAIRERAAYFHDDLMDILKRVGSLIEVINMEAGAWEYLSKP